MHTFGFDCRGARSSAAIYRAESPRCTLVLAHGAGAPRTHPWMVTMAKAIASHGIDVVTFNFLYSEAKRRAPDKNDALEATWLAALEAVRARDDLPTERLFVGGKSMGGRIATQVVAKGAHVGGIVLLGYPLHPPGQPDKLRSAHLPDILVPMLFVQGERDAFGTPEELAPIVKRLSKGTRLFVVEGGDHSLISRPRRGKAADVPSARPKSSGESLDQTLARVAAEVARFIA
jgi:predicted alpha/beta-hydrolase family hydrolase